MSAEEDLSSIAAGIKRHAAGASRIVFVSGNFNIVHPGHLRLLQFAAECGDFLVVGVHDRHMRGAILPEELRLEAIRSIGIVGYAFILHHAPEVFIAALKPAVVVKGKEYEDQQNAEQQVVDAYGGKLLFGSGEVRFSSLHLLQKEFRELNFSNIVKPQDFPERHGFTMADLKTTLARVRGLRVAVIGDLIVDEYVNCEPLGMSQEDPTIVVTPIHRDKFIGGAAIVAAHAGGLGADVSYFSVCGTDPIAQFAREKLEEYGVHHETFSDDSRPTTLKQRFRAEGKTLLRVSQLRQHDINRELSDQLFAAIGQALNDTDLLIFSDFNYGCLPQALVDRIVALCRDRGVMAVADSQSSSQVGDVSRFKDMALITPTEREARLAVRDFNSGLVVLAEELRQKSRASNIVLTLGAEGLLVHAPDNGTYGSVTDRLPTLNTAPKDPAGAGDSFLTCAAMSLAVGANIWLSTYLGSLAAACQVSRVGNVPLTTRDIEIELDL